MQPQEIKQENGEILSGIAGVSDIDVHGTPSFVKISIRIRLSTAQIRTSVVHVSRENGCEMLRLRVSRFARNDSRSDHDWIYFA